MLYGGVKPGSAAQGGSLYKDDFGANMIYLEEDRMVEKRAQGNNTDRTLSTWYMQVLLLLFYISILP